jgi:hypothetical protein
VRKGRVKCCVGLLMRRADVSEGGLGIRPDEGVLGKEKALDGDVKTWLSLGCPWGCACGCPVLRRESFNGRPERAVLAQ